MVRDDIEKILVGTEEISKRSKEIGEQISKDYEGKRPILIALLKGSVPFLSELMKYITIEMEVDFMDVSSYEGTKSTQVRINKDLDSPIEDRDVIIVEDIIDTGKTLKTVVELLYQKGASSVKVASLLNKPEGRKVDIEADYVGFVIPDEFVVGYGLDFNQVYRNLPYVGVLKERCYKELIK